MYELSRENFNTGPPSNELEDPAYPTHFHEDQI